MTEQTNDPATSEQASTSGEAPKPFVPVVQQAASLAVYKRELRREIRKRALEPEVNFLNITAMMDMMTIILVFLLKSMSSSNAAVPQSADLQLPKSILTTEAAQDGLAVVVSKSNIIVDNNAVCPVPAAPATAIDGKYKRSGPGDLYIVPLANALQAWRDNDKRVRTATGRDASSSEAIIIADANTPYRILVEVLYTLGETEFGKLHMMVMQGAKK
jgi:biopolymer transport protein ExbD